MKFSGTLKSESGIGLIDFVSDDITFEVGFGGGITGAVTCEEGAGITGVCGNTGGVLIGALFSGNWVVSEFVCW